jgi:hypothetical protein
MKTREFNKIVRDMFKLEVPERRWFNCSYYNDGRAGGESRRVFKSVGSERYRAIWLKIIDQINEIDPGWELFVGYGSWGDGSVYGMVKVSAN